MEKIHIGILVVSDSCNENKSVDVSGAKLKDYIAESKKVDAVVERYAVCPDDRGVIKAYLVGWCREDLVDVIVTSGGTGFTPRDVTPEATREAIEKEAPSFQQVILLKSLEKTKFAPLSRGICGIRDNKLIINLPGSAKGTLEGFQFIEELLHHAVDQLRGRSSAVKRTHSQLGNSHQAIEPSSPKTEDSKKLKSTVDVVRIADRPRESPYPIVKVPQALDTIMQCVFLTNEETVPLAESFGRYLTKDVVSGEALPPFPASIKDGYAVVASDGSGERTVIGTATAGDYPVESLRPGTCMRVSTGAPVPKGADAVVQVEDTEVIEASGDRSQEIRILIRTVPKVGQDIRPAGSEVGVGQCLVAVGRRIGPADIGMFGSVGIGSVTCHRVPCVGVLSTGNEIVDVDSQPKDGQIRDSNRIMLINLLREIGCRTVDLGIAADDPDILLQVLCNAMETCDIVVSSGGVSMGEKDLLKRVLTEDLGAKIHFGRVFMKPGKPTTFATIQKKERSVLFFGLPGNPVSSIVTCHLFVAPVIRAMQGSKHKNATTIKVRLRGPAIKLDPRPEYHRCILDWSSSSDGIPLAVSTGNQLSARLLSVTGANALLTLPPSTSSKPTVEENEIIEAMIISCI